MTWGPQCSRIAGGAARRSSALGFVLLAGCYLSFELGPGDGPPDGGGTGDAGELRETAAVQLAAGTRHTCAVQRSGGVKCWGSDEYGQLGDGPMIAAGLAPVTVEELHDAARVAAGRFTTCAVHDSGRAACWGGGWVGDGTTTDHDTPRRVLDVTDATTVSVRGVACALRSSGHVACWGGNDNGQLGDGTTTDRTSPVEVRDVTDATGVSAGGLFACALRRSGHVACWGAKGSGQLGDGSHPSGSRLTPVEVVGVTDATAVRAGEAHACALRASGRVVCWGYNRDGRLGNGETAWVQPTPVQVKGLRDAVAVTAGGEHTCALRESGEVVCWGNNNAGQLGDRSTKDRKEPVEVDGLTDATDVAAGGAHTCALRASGEVLCWGSNADGQLGDGTTINRSQPVAVKGL